MGKNQKILIGSISSIVFLFMACCAILFFAPTPDESEEPPRAGIAEGNGDTVQATAELEDISSESTLAGKANEIQDTSAFEESDSVSRGEQLSVDTVTPEPLLTNTSRPTATEAPITNTPLPQNTVTSTSTPTAFPTTTPENMLPDGTVGQLAVVTNVVDGDTIDVSMSGQTYRVRYIGMDTPERGDWFFNEATEVNRGLVSGKTVILVKDVSETDRYDRLLRYVYLTDGTFVNAELVKQGYAQIATYPPDVKFQDYFLELQQEAVAEGRGLWAQPTATMTSRPTNTPRPLPTATLAPLPTSPPPTPIPPTPMPQPTPVPTQPPADNCHPSYPTVCIPPPPPDLNCGDIPHRRFTVLPPDPHGFDRDNDGIGCES